MWRGIPGVARPLQTPIFEGKGELSHVLSLEDFIKYTQSMLS